MSQEQRRPTSEAELVELVRAIDERAPESLHRSVRQLIAARQRPRASALGAPARARRGAAAGALAACVAAAALVIALSSGGGGAAGPSLSQAAALTLRPATAAAPGESGRTRGELAAAVQGVAFPYWEEDLGWRSTGARRDTLAGRGVTTVFYTDARGRRVGYAIVAGEPAPRVSGGRLWWHRGTAYRVLYEHGVAVISWLRDGHLCVVSGRGVSASTLLRLASWRT